MEHFFISSQQESSFMSSQYYFSLSCPAVKSKYLQINILKQLIG